MYDPIGCVPISPDEQIEACSQALSAHKAQNFLAMTEKTIIQNGFGDCHEIIKDQDLVQELPN